MSGLSHRMMERLLRARTLIAVMLLATLMRLLFWTPYFVTSDILDYLNTFELLSTPEWVEGKRSDLADVHHLVRLALVLPLALSNGLGWQLAVYPLLCSLGVVLLTYKIARHLSDSTGAIIAAVIVAVTPVEVVHGTLPLPDVPLGLFALFSFWLLIRMDEPDVWTIFLAGVGLGVAYTCKVTALFLCPLAFLQVLSRRWRLGDALWLCCGVGIVIIVETVALRWMLEEWHVRIIELFGFIPGTRGNYAEVDRTAAWWFGQIWFKIRGLWFGGHLPMTALYGLLPHFYVVALFWGKRKLRGKVGWVVGWGGIWLMQQLLISAIEPDPRYYHVAVPYMAIVVGVVSSPLWDKSRRIWQWCLSCPALGVALLGAVAFKATFTPVAEGTRWLSHQLEELAEQSTVTVGSSSYNVIRMAFFSGVDTVKHPGIDKNVTHLVEWTTGYERRNEIVQQDGQNGWELWRGTEYHHPLVGLMMFLGHEPGVGYQTTVKILRKSNE